MLENHQDIFIILSYAISFISLFILVLLYAMRYRITHNKLQKLREQRGDDTET